MTTTRLEERDIGETLSVQGRHRLTCISPTGPRAPSRARSRSTTNPSLRALKRARCSGWLTMECKATDNAEAALAGALAYIKRQWADA